MFDCHTHVQFAAFDNDWKATIDRALAAGVSIINVGTQKDTSLRAVEIANLYKTGVYAAIGLHPVHTTKSFHDAQELGDGPAAAAFVSRGEEFDHALYARLAEDPKVVALGECGFDPERIGHGDTMSRIYLPDQRLTIGF
jgi:TatD DNase family protein